MPEISTIHSWCADWGWATLKAIPKSATWSKMSGNSVLRIAIIDDHPIFRAGLRRLLESEPGVEVVAEGSAGAQAPQLVRESAAEILLIDLSMPESDGLTGLRLLQQSAVDVRPIVLTAAIGRQETLEALRLGAFGVLLKSSAAELVFKCLNEVMRGRYWIDRDTVGSLVEALRLQQSPPASGEALPKELNGTDIRILQALRRGARNKQIARELGIAEQTVKNSLSRLYARMGVAGRMELILKATQSGLLPSNPGE